METSEHANGHNPRLLSELAESSLLNTDDEDVALDDLPIDPETALQEENEQEDKALEQFLEAMEPEGEFVSHSWHEMDEADNFFDDEIDELTEDISSVISESIVSDEFEDEEGVEKQTSITDEIALLKYLARQSVRSKEPTKAALIASTMAPVVLRTQPQASRMLWPAITILAPAIWQVAYRWHRQNRKQEIQRIPFALVHTVAYLAQRVQERKRLNRTIVLSTFKRELSQQRPFS